MASIAVRKSTSEPTAPGRRAPSSPIDVVRDLLRWDPFAQMLPQWGEDERTMFVPDFDVKETKDGFVFSADLPGIDPKDLDIKLAQNRLTISGKKEETVEEKSDTVYRRERSYGSFSRSFTLPDEADSDRANAEIKNGVLTLTLPKRPEATPKKIDVKSS